MPSPPPSYRPRVPYTGPPPVIPWYERDVKHTTPSCLRKQFARFETRSRQLAESEKLLVEVEALPLEERHPDALKNLRARVENARAHLDYSAETLRQLVTLSLQRFDPTLPVPEGHLLRYADRVYDTGRNPRGRTHKKNQAQIRHYARVLDAYRDARAVAAGHSGASDALTRLRSLCTKSIAKYVGSSPRERADAEQQALLGIMKAAAAYDPHHAALAKFSTYAAPKIRRAIEARKAGDTAAGLAMKSGKVITVNSLSKPISKTGDGPSADQLLPSAATDSALALDIQEAMDLLTPEERIVFERHKVGREALAAIGADYGLSAYQTGKILKGALKKLQEALANWSVQG